MFWAFSSIEVTSLCLALRKAVHLACGLGGVSLWILVGRGFATELGS